MNLDSRVSPLVRFSNWGNAFFVSIYKLMGFVILSVIVVGMVSYLFSAMFFILQNNWLVPDMVTSADPRVIQARSQFLQKKSELLKIENELSSLSLDKKHIVFAIDMLNQFQNRFQMVALKERGLKESQLQQFQGLLDGTRLSVQQLTQIQKDFGKTSQTQAVSQFNSRLIDNSEVLQKQVMVHQMEISDWGYKQRLAEMQLKVQELRGTLDSSRNSKSPSDLASLAALQQDHTFLQTQLAISDFQSKLQSVESNLPKQENLRHEVQNVIEAMKLDPFLKPMSSSEENSSFQIGLVQYETLKEAREGSAVYGCYFGLIFCKKIGKMGKIYGGEQKFDHPITKSSLRGRYVELLLDKNSWAYEAHLFLHHAPFWI